MTKARLNIVCDDRYSALGIRRPSLSTMCNGQCEGTGWVPAKQNDRDKRLRELWAKAHQAAGRHKCDGYHFVRCPDCGGTGRRK